MPPVPKILILSLLFALNVVPVESSPTMVSLASPVVVESPDANNGIFTYYMLKGLRGDADNGDKVITVEELHNYIRKNVHDKTKSLYSSLPQTPQLFTEKPEASVLLAKWHKCITEHFINGALYLLPD